MQFEQYVTPYNKPQIRWDLENEPADVFEAMARWDHTFSAILYAYLSGESVEVGEEIAAKLSNPNAFIDEYDEWERQAETDLGEAVGRIETEMDARLMGKGDFHALNTDMSYMWFPLLVGGWGENDSRRLMIINAVQDQLAHRGMEYYKEREQLANKRSTKDQTSFFTNGFRHYRRWFNGHVNEIDGGIVLLEMIKPYPNLTVVPAPQTFERAKDDSTNADYLVIDMDKREVVGVQAKSMLIVSQYNEDGTEIPRKDYESDRIVVIDCSAELGNAAIRRFTTNTSKERRYSWPGLISAYRILNLPVHGPDSWRGKVLYEQNGNPKGTLAQKLMAKQALRDAPKSMFKEATKNLTGRIIPALYRPTPQSDQSKQKEAEAS